jgi:hypothetical protein
MNQKSQNYCPTPLDDVKVELPSELLENIELLAKNVHEEWARKRIGEGWQYGHQRDDVKKLHPSLILYDELSEEEKEYDRQTALSTLKMVISLGFRIE